MHNGVEFQITFALQVVFAVSGIIGNALVLCVFSRIKHKRSATIFILTLAATDFITCLVTIPFTIVYEVLNYHLIYDTVCKLYHFLITSTVPFSAFIMVAIAIDRYVTICHPFLQLMTVKRARVIVSVLACFACTLGILCCVQFGVYHPLPNLRSFPNNLSDDTGGGIPDNSEIVDDFKVQKDTRKQSNALGPNMDSSTVATDGMGDTVLTWTGNCRYSELVFSREFLMYFQKIYASCFGICGVMVIVLYSLIFKSVAIWRKRGVNIDQRTRHLEDTDHTVMSNTSDDLGLEEIEIVEMKKQGTEKDELCDNSNRFANSNEPSMSGPRSVARFKLEKRRMANVKTAFMLFVVAKVFIIAFLPAWLMALGAIPVSMAGFYMYFVYHVANPVIYAFARKSFRRRLKDLCRWR